MKLRSFLLFRWITDFLKGMLIGISMLIPGISGGTMAIILGIYNDLIGAVSGFFRSKGKSIFLLIRVGAGLCIGAALLSEKLLMLFRLFPELSVFFFIGAISGSLPMLLRESEPKSITVYFSADKIMVDDVMPAAYVDICSDRSSSSIYSEASS